MNEESRGGEGERRACRAMSIFPPGKNGKFVGIPSALRHSLSSPLFLLRLYTRACVKSCVGFEKEFALGLIDPLAARIFLRERTMPLTSGGQAFKVMYEGNWTIRFERQISGGAYPMQLYLERERDWIKGVMQSGLSQGIIQRVQALRGSNPVYHRLTRARLSGGGEGRNSSFTPFLLVVSSDYFNPR